MKNRTIIIILLICLLIVSGCSHLNYSGDTATTNKLRGDLTEMVQKKFNSRLGYDCPIESIHTEVIDYIPNSKTKQIERMLELWVATGCRQTILFNVAVKTDKKRGDLLLYVDYRR